MIIGIDARNFFESAPSPAAHVVLAVYDELIRQMTDARFLFFYQYNRWRSGWREFADRFREVVNRANVRCECIPLDADVADTWLHVRLPLVARDRRLSCLHLPDGIAPTWCPVPMILNVAGEQVRSAAEKTADGLVLARAWRRAALAGASFVTPVESDAAQLSIAFELPSAQVFADRSLNPNLACPAPSESPWPDAAQMQDAVRIWRKAMDAAQAAFRAARPPRPAPATSVTD